MPRSSPTLVPRLTRLLEQLGHRIRLARLRRRFSAELVAARAGISRKTLQRVERGDPAVAMGIYARVLQALRLDQDLAQIAVDDQLGRRLQDAELETPLRAPRTRSAARDIRNLEDSAEVLSGNTQFEDEVEESE